jgi:hypothetical protein
MRRKLILLAGLLAIPATASANAGVPIAPMVGMSIAFYLPLLITVELVVIRWRLKVSWMTAAAWSAKWNAITTLLGFPLLLMLIFAVFTMLYSAAPDFLDGYGVLGHIFWTFPPSPYPEPQPDSWKVFVTCSSLIWTVVAFSLSVAVEEWLAKREPTLAATPRRLIHTTVLYGNMLSYLPLWAIMIGEGIN